MEVSDRAIEIGLICVIAVMSLVIIILLTLLRRRTVLQTNKAFTSFQVLHRLNQLQHNPINKKRSNSNSASSEDADAAQNKHIDGFYNPDGISG